MLKWFSIVVSVFGVLFFAFHLLLTVTYFYRAGSREYRGEAIGQLIPGTAGLCLVAAVLIPSRLFSGLLCLLGLPILILGQAIYEHFVFRNRRD